MKKKGGRRPQHGKNRSRPRAWHRGAAAGKDYARKAVPLAAAEDRAAALAAEVEPAAREIRRSTKDTAEMEAALDRVAPFVPRFDAIL